MSEKPLISPPPAGKAKTHKTQLFFHQQVSPPSRTILQDMAVILHQHTPGAKWQVAFRQGYRVARVWPAAQCSPDSKSQSRIKENPHRRKETKSEEKKIVYTHTPGLLKLEHNAQLKRRA
jgi:hypothetical protein